MPKGFVYLPYLCQPRIEKPIEQIYRELDEFVQEFFEDEPHLYDFIDFWVVLPPLYYEGKFVKGIMFSQAVDLLVQRYPQLPQLFWTIANSRWCAYPWSQHADGYFVLYHNPQREAWFRQTYPERADKFLIPLQTADFTNETIFAPKQVPYKDIDLICVSRLDQCKNLPMLAEGLKIYRAKYDYPLRMTLITGNKDMERAHLNDHEINVLDTLEKTLVPLSDYIDWMPSVEYFRQLPLLFSRSKACVLGSLVEGKNRSMVEAVCCDTPVVCFEQYNQYARNEAPIGVKDTVWTSPFDAESLADTLHTVLSNHEALHPRISYMKYHGGIKYAFNCCIDHIPYYRNQLPDYMIGAHDRNIWIDLAIQANYQLSTYDFIHDRNPLLSHQRGLSDIDKMMDQYLSRFREQIE